MTTYIIRRLLMGVIVILLVTLIVFLIMRLLPGDPLTLYLSINEIANLPAEKLDILRHEFGIDKSLPLQYIDWVGGVLHGNLGLSIFFHDNVERLLGERLPVTMPLGAMALLVSTTFGITFGVICALRRGKWIDSVLTVLANLGITVPSFWVGILLIYLLAFKLGWLPTSGYTSPFDNLGMSIKQSIMPVFCLSIFSIAALTRQTRSCMLEVIQQDYIRTAWAKGLREQAIIIRHTVKNALIPVVTMIGMQVSMIFGGSVLIETVFGIPGVGRLLTQSALQQDYQVVQGGVLMIATIIVLVNIAVDICYGWLDPRIRYD